jgi:hypothetical protein
MMASAFDDSRDEEEEEEELQPPPVKEGYLHKRNEFFQWQRCVV